MNSNDAELLIRYLDNKALPEEREKIAALLRTDPDARMFLRDVAEQAVMIADLERVTGGQFLQPSPLDPLGQPGGAAAKLTPFYRRPWFALAASLVALLAALAGWLIRSRSLHDIRVVKVTGSAQFMGAHGQGEREVQAGAILRAGDALETRSANVWIEMELPGGSRMTLAGHSSLRVLEPRGDALQLKLNQGSLWASSVPSSHSNPLIIPSPAVVMETHGARFDLHTCAAESTVRVNEGSIRAKSSSSINLIEVPAGQQMTAQLGDRTLKPQLQPTPIHGWRFEPDKSPRVTLGLWLPSDGKEPSRLGAEPLLWPLPNRDPILLHAVAISVVQSSDQPVLLQTGAKLVFQGRTDKAQTVRFGFSAQKMRGAFAGKFEMDVPPETLGTPGKPWKVSLPIANFRALEPGLSPSPEGLELSDVYALTVIQEAGLELHQVELTQGEEIQKPAMEKDIR